MSARDSTRDAVTRRIAAARRDGKKIDVKYDEVPTMLDVVLEHARAATEQGTETLRDLARALDEGPPTRNLRRVV